jgi:hypothetical protein
LYALVVVTTPIVDAVGEPPWQRISKVIRRHVRKPEGEKNDDNSEEENKARPEPRLLPKCGAAYYRGDDETRDNQSDVSHVFTISEGKRRAAGPFVHEDSPPNWIARLMCH